MKVFVVMEITFSVHHMHKKYIPLTMHTESESGINSSLDYNNISTNGSNTVCAENYYLSDKRLCMPLCSLWVDPFRGAGLDADNIAILISVVTAELSAIILLIISLSIQRKFM